MAEPSKMQLDIDLGGPINQVLNGGAYGHHLANTVEQLLVTAEPKMMGSRLA